MTKHFHKILSDSEKLISDIMQRAVEEYTGLGIESIKPSRLHTSTISGAPDRIYIYVDGDYIGNITREYNSNWKQLQIKFHPPGPVDKGPPESQLDRQAPKNTTDLDRLVTFLTHTGTPPVVNDMSRETYDGVGAKLIRLADGEITGSPFEATVCPKFGGASDGYIDYLFTNEGELIEVNVWTGD